MFAVRKVNAAHSSPSTAHLRAHASAEDVSISTPSNKRAVHLVPATGTTKLKKIPSAHSAVGSLVIIVVVVVVVVVEVVVGFSFG